MEEIPFGKPYWSTTLSGSKRKKVQRCDVFYYVPLLKTLKNLLLLDEVLAEVLNPHFAADGKLGDFCDGAAFRSHPLFGTDNSALQVIAYYDELEVANPIGSYVSKHKLGCLFFMLGNIRPKYRSTLKAINLVAVARHADVVKYGLDIFLTPFVQDLKTLYCDGITVTVGSDIRTFHGGLLAFLADNLAAHAIGGFKEGVGFALRLCRTCMATQSQSQMLFTEDKFQLRNPDMHFQQCQLLVGPLKGHFSTNFGINRCSILEEIPGFSVSSCMPHDIMHDLFEGVVPYEMKQLIVHCVEQKFFSIQLLNDRLSHFDFISNKPSLIDKDFAHTSSRFRQSASQMITLCFNLPLLVGDKVPEHDKKWLSFLLLLRICEIALSPICTSDTIAYLRLLVEEKLTVFKEIYPHCSITPKFHYMIHYPTQIEKFGPLITSWTMRHESKLSFVKRASKRSNFKNVAKTVANRHQRWQCYKLQMECPFLHVTFECSPKSVTYNFEEESGTIVQEILRLFPSIDRQSSIDHPKWVKMHSYTYSKNVFLLLDYDPICPKFGKITDIVVVNDTVLFSLNVHTVDFYDSHYHAFVINSTHDDIVLLLDSLLYHYPLYQKYSFQSGNSQKYIVMPFYF